MFLVLTSVLLSSFLQGENDLKAGLNGYSCRNIQIRKEKYLTKIAKISSCSLALFIDKKTCAAAFLICGGFMTLHAIITTIWTSNSRPAGRLLWHSCVSCIIAQQYQNKPTTVLFLSPHKSPKKALRVFFCNLHNPLYLTGLLSWKICLMRFQPEYETLSTVTWW